MKSWYPGNLEVTIEKTCQSYSSMMASMSRASCCRAAPNWKNVDFSSCNNRQTPETVSRFVWGTEIIAEEGKKRRRRAEVNEFKSDSKNPIELKPFSILQSVSQSWRAPEIRERVSVRGTKEEWGEMGKRGRQRDAERVRFHRQHCERGTAGNGGA